MFYFFSCRIFVIHRTQIHPMAKISLCVISERCSRQGIMIHGNFAKCRVRAFKFRASCANDC